MSAPSQAPAPAAVVGPDVSAIVTEDDAPVDNLYSEKQMRLLTDALYTSWGGPPPEESGQRRTFLAAANVGVFKTPKAPPLVPDVLVSVDVGPDPDIWAKEHRSYFIWEFGKEPDVVIEVVSNREGKELDEKKIGYRRMKIPYYVVWDPETFLRSAPLQAFELRGHLYVKMGHLFFESLGLGLTEWVGTFEHFEARWLRWCDAEGKVLPTGAERATIEQVRADSERARADHERERADNERERADHERERADSARAQGMAEAVLAVLAARAVLVDADARARVLACRDAATLAGWIARAATATAADDLFA